MALLKGFPPSNMIQTDMPTPWSCDLCGKKFWQSFPLSLGLDFTKHLQFRIMPCRECYEEDQGRKYWSQDLNKWGDYFNIYSKVREGYSYEKIEMVYLESVKNDYKIKSHIWFNSWEFPLDKDNVLNKICWHLIFKLHDRMSPWNRPINGHDPEIGDSFTPTKFILIMNQKLANVFKND